MTHTVPWNPRETDSAFIVTFGNAKFVGDPDPIEKIVPARIVEVHDDRMYVVDGDKNFRQVRLPLPQFNRPDHYVVTPRGKEADQGEVTLDSHEQIVPKGETLNRMILRFETQSVFDTLEGRLSTFANELHRRRRWDASYTWEDHDELIGRLETVAHEAREAFNAAKEARDDSFLHG